MISRKAKYALKAMLFLARQGAGEVVTIEEIAEREGIPKKYLESILLALRNRGLLASRKGRGGGYALAASPGDIRFGEIVRTMDGPLAPVPCVSVTAYRACGECAAERTCEIRLVMKRVREAVAEVLDTTSLKDALRESDRALRRAGK